MDQLTDMLLENLGIDPDQKDAFAKQISNLATAAQEGDVPQLIASGMNIYSQFV